MDIKVNTTTPVTQIPDTVKTELGDGSFKYTLASAIGDAELQAKIDGLLNDITTQGNLIAQHMDIRDMKKYREKIREIMRYGGPRMLFVSPIQVIRHMYLEWKDKKNINTNA